MAASNSQALVKRSSDMALMPPPPPPKRQKRPAKVLDEDVYSDALSHIIARDYFPGLVETEAQKDYLEALDSKNNEWIRQAGRKLTQVMTPGPDGRRRQARGTRFTPLRTSEIKETPRDFNDPTPQRTPVNDDFASDVKPVVDVNLSLGSFQAKYTSEDNESFNALLDKQNQRRAEKYSFFHHGNKIPSARQIAHRAREQKLIGNGTNLSAIALTGKNADEEERHILASIGPSENLDVRPASVDSFRNSQGPRNSFMFDPEGVEDQGPTTAQNPERDSNAPPRTVNYAGTRLAAAAIAKADSFPPISPSLSAIDAAIAARSMATYSESNYSGAETPRINGYAFVDAEPTPSEVGIPVTDEEADAAEREAATQLLPKVDDSGPNPFNMADRSKREDLHMRLVEKADASRRADGRLGKLRSLGLTPGRTPTPRFSSAAGIKKGAAMTPAAQRLAERIRTPRRDGASFSSVQEAKVGWTPTPHIK